MPYGAGGSESPSWATPWGGGVAALMAALLNFESDLPPVKCFSYATPACCSVPLAAHLKGHVVSCVLQDDAVPRLSDANCALLAKDLVDDDANYRARFAKDRAAYAAHVKTLGKREAMVHERTLPLQAGQWLWL